MEVPMLVFREEYAHRTAVDESIHAVPWYGAIRRVARQRVKAGIVPKRRESVGEEESVTDTAAAQVGRPSSLRKPWASSSSLNGGLGSLKRDPGLASFGRWRERGEGLSAVASATARHWHWQWTTTELDIVRGLGKASKGREGQMDRRVCLTAFVFVSAIDCLVLTLWDWRIGFGQGTLSASVGSWMDPAT